MRDRLIKLLKQAEKQQSLNAVCGDIDSLIDSPKGAEFIADYLIANGVIHIPCKVGTEVYLSDYIDKHHRLKEYKFIGNKIAVVIECWEFQGTCTRWLDDFGKNIFLTREEAERALKGGE